MPPPYPDTRPDDDARMWGVGGPAARQAAQERLRVDREAAHDATMARKAAARAERARQRRARRHRLGRADAPATTNPNGA